MGCDGGACGGGNPLMQRRSSILVRFAAALFSNPSSLKSIADHVYLLTSMATLLGPTLTCLGHCVSESRVYSSGVVVGFGCGVF